MLAALASVSWDIFLRFLRMLPPLPAMLRFPSPETFSLVLGLRSSPIGDA